jgi:hypothetical protein
MFIEVTLLDEPYHKLLLNSAIVYYVVATEENFTNIVTKEDEIYVKETYAEIKQLLLGVSNGN